MPIVTGLDGTVVLSPAVCRVFAPLLRRAITEANRRDGARFPNEIWDELGALEAAARAKNLERSRVSEVPSGTVRNMNEVEGLKAAGKILGCSPQAVHERCQRGTLPFVRDERGRYFFARENLE